MLKLSRTFMFILFYQCQLWSEDRCDIKKKKSLIFGYNFSCLLTNVKTLFKMGM